MHVSVVHVLSPTVTSTKAVGWEEAMAYRAGLAKPTVCHGAGQGHTHV